MIRHRTYPADLDVANRLYAARRAAGFKSIRDLSRAKGWSEPTFRAHETANRSLEASTARIYAEGLGVTEDWLLRGRGEGPPVDPVRRARFAARQDAASGSDEVPAQALRLRLARRLAGYASVSEAAAAAGLKRSTLSAHEVGQNALSPMTATLYGGAFGCSGDWLLDGRLPSGYPPRVEARLDDLLGLYDAPERQVRAELDAFGFRAPTAPIADRSTDRPVAETQAIAGDIVPELSEPALLGLAAASDRDTAVQAGTIRRWCLPPGEAMASFRCAPGMAAIMAVGRRFAAAEAGDRLILDLGPTAAVVGATYLVVGRDGRLDAVVWGSGAPDGATVVARVAGVIRAFRA